MSRRRKPLPTETVETNIESLSHDGRGVTHIDGKTIFIDGALPGERVKFLYSKIHRKFDEAYTVEVLDASPIRTTPLCSSFGICGGCSLQHMQADAQIINKQQILLDNLWHIGKVKPAEILAPLTSEHWGYRRKARMGAKYVKGKQRVLVGFREKRKPYLAELENCEVLHPSVGKHLQELSTLIMGLSCYDQIPQIEVAVGDEITALVFRVLTECSETDKQALIEFAQKYNFAIYLQPKGPDSVSLLYPEQVDLFYVLPEYNIKVHFQPTDFTQVNQTLNIKMVAHAMSLLKPETDDRILELFCGLGNFSLPIASTVQELVAVEGEAGLVKRAEENAQVNGLSNVEYHVANLEEDNRSMSWLRKQSYNKIFLDPPRSGAAAILPQLAKTGANRIVYVSCNPATLARDAEILVHEMGFRLVSAGVMDMFPHTAHVESIALFEK